MAPSRRGPGAGCWALTQQVLLQVGKWPLACRRWKIPARLGQPPTVTATSPGRGTGADVEAGGWTAGARWWGWVAGPGGGAGGWLFGELPPREVLCALHAGVRKPPAEERASSHPPIGALSSELPGVVSRAPPAAASVHGEPAHICLPQREPCMRAITSAPVGGPGGRSPARVPGPESREG